MSRRYLVSFDIRSDWDKELGSGIVSRDFECFVLAHTRKLAVLRARCQLSIAFARRPNVDREFAWKARVRKVEFAPGSTT